MFFYRECSWRGASGSGKLTLETLCSVIKISFDEKINKFHLVSLFRSSDNFWPSSAHFPSSLLKCVPSAQITAEISTNEKNREKKGKSQEAKERNSVRDGKMFKMSSRLDYARERAADLSINYDVVCGNMRT